MSLFAVAATSGHAPHRFCMSKPAMTEKAFPTAFHDQLLLFFILLYFIYFLNINPDLSLNSLYLVWDLLWCSMVNFFNKNLYNHWLSLTGKYNVFDKNNKQVLCIILLFGWIYNIFDKTPSNYAKIAFLIKPRVPCILPINFWASVLLENTCSPHVYSTLFCILGWLTGFIISKTSQGL